jgi:MFS family permease
MPPTEPDPPSESPAAILHDPYAAVRSPNFRRYWSGNFVSILGTQMQTATLVWEVFDRTKDPFMVGLVDLVIVVPVLSLALLAGHVADRFNRRRVLITSLTVNAFASLGLAFVSFHQIAIAALFACVFVIGVARAFQQPTKSSLLPQLVPRAIFSNAVAWNLSGFQLAAVVGPALGGWVLALFDYAYIVYLLQATACVTFIVQLLRVRQTVASEPHQAATLKSLGEGITFVWNKKAVLGAMALDMFAVLLGGATALLPVFAAEILQVGKIGYGFLWSAPAAGALVMSLLLVHRRPMAKAGQTLLWTVAGFGVSIIVFGLSTSFYLSLFALFMTGMFDCVSVVVRHTLVQVLTPDRMRGRVSAISGMFISASNELGGFESGTVAKLFSPVIAVVSGGIGTLIVVATAAVAVPDLRNYGRLDGHDHHEDEPPHQSEPQRAATPPIIAPAGDAG